MGRWSFLLGVLLLSVAVAQIPKEVPVSTLAYRFLKSLPAEQKSKAQKAFADEYRKNWRFVPASREGVNLGELNAEQIGLATALLKACLSDAGYIKVETIKSLEDVLFELEGGNKGRDKRLYTFTFFGEPSSVNTWGWRYEGHHTSLNFTYDDGKLISSTPQFMGANPAEVRSGPQKGLRALQQEQDAAFAFIGSLNKEQLGKAVISDSAPNEIITSNARKVGIQESKGISYNDLTKDQKEALLGLMKIYSHNQTDLEFKRRQSRIEPSSVVFAWMGSTKPGAGHYYRIQSSKFLIEYDNTQNDANHIHTVWRDFDGDFGEDVLAGHYAKAH